MNRSLIANGYFDNNMIECKLQQMFYNINGKIGIIITTNIFKSATGEFIVEVDHSVFLPQNY